MKSAPLERLQNHIVKPGLEKHLEPLLYYRGNQTLGRVHRLWNLTVSAMEQECETTADITQRLIQNPEYSHLLGPGVAPQRMSLTGFWSRLLDNPHIAANQPGLLNYVRDLDFLRLRLSPVEPTAARSRCAPWRTFVSRMAEWRALQAERKAERKAARDLERAARADERAAAREARRAIILRQREELRAARERKKREPKKFVLRETPARTLSYPFMIHDGGKPEHTLMRKVLAAVPKWLDPDLRADICQDLIVGVLCGDFSEDDLGLPVKEVTRKIRKMHPGKYGPLSLDAIVPGTDNLRLMDTIAG